MTNDTTQANLEEHLRVFSDRSEYHQRNGDVQIFREGPFSTAAKTRADAVRAELDDGFLDRQIEALSAGSDFPNTEKISSAASSAVRNLVATVTSEVGRALIGLTVMQLTVKALSPEQSVRLHKASGGKRNFSWVDGISLRTLDKKFVTPALRRHGLLRLNADGFMMTRSLAENYPYSPLYKANIRGARKDWLCLVEELETGRTDAENTLKLLLTLLINAAGTFQALADELVGAASQMNARTPQIAEVQALVKGHVLNSGYSARLLEIAMHSLAQAAFDVGAFEEFTLKPLSQMRSANKKHGNVGDIEILLDGEIFEAWDAKYGKADLREEIEEVGEKLESHPDVVTVGFVTDAVVEHAAEVIERASELADLHSVDMLLMSFDGWVDRIARQVAKETTGSPDALGHAWLLAYCETLAQRRRERAPVDEPCARWVERLLELIAR